jgi:hypothetical protein
MIAEAPRCDTKASSSLVAPLFISNSTPSHNISTSWSSSQSLRNCWAVRHSNSLTVSNMREIRTRLKHVRVSIKSGPRRLSSGEMSDPARASSSPCRRSPPYYPGSLAPKSQRNMALACLKRNGSRASMGTYSRGERATVRVDER